MKNNFVIVTSLYNLSGIKRDDDRDWETYLKWFSKTLEIKCPFIIFTEPNLYDFIMKYRNKNSTFIINESLDQVPLYYLKNQIQSILDSDEYKRNMSDPKRVECKDSMYSIIQYSKFKWMQKASEVNPFNSEYFFWLDAGASRFIDRSDIKNKYPSEDAIEKLKGIDNTFLLQYNPEYYSDLVNSNSLSKNYFWDNRSFICGSMFGGNAEAIKVINKEIDNIMKLMISTGCVNNEQIALGYLCKNKENLFTRFYRTNSQKHLCLFQEMS